MSLGVNNLAERSLNHILTFLAIIVDTEAVSYQQ